MSSNQPKQRKPTKIFHLKRIIFENKAIYQLCYILGGKHVAFIPNPKEAETVCNLLNKIHGQEKPYDLADYITEAPTFTHHTRVPQSKDERKELADALEKEYFKRIDAQTEAAKAEAKINQGDSNEQA